MAEEIKTNIGGYVNWKSTDCSEGKLAMIHHEGYYLSPTDADFLLKTNELSEKIFQMIKDEKIKLPEFKIPEFKLDVSH